MCFTVFDFVGIILLLVVVLFAFFGLRYAFNHLKYGERCYRLEKLIPVILYYCEFCSIEDAKKAWYRYMSDYPKEFHIDDEQQKSGLP